MRLLIACNQCQRQYDATGRPVGSRFRCHCGAVVEVREPRGHDAAVVRCSSCGAPREEGSRACRFCGADFTLHERDLHTVCPRCFARVSDRANYCHHCALAIVPETVAGDETPRTCPACRKEQPLFSRRIGDVTVLECPVCAGMWLGNNAFRQLTARAGTAGAVADFRLNPASRARPGDGKQTGPLYRRCIECGRLMNRQNYARRSGVIIDVCRDHGVWFDAEELPRLLAWIRAGGQARAEEKDTAEQLHRERMRRLSKPVTGRARSLEDLDDTDMDSEVELGRVLTEVFFWLCGR